MSSDGSASAPVSPLRGDEVSPKAIPRTRVAPQRPGSPATMVVAKRRAAPARAAPARAASSQGLRASSPQVRISPTTPGKTRRAAPARRAESTHARSSSSGGAAIAPKPLKQSNSAGSEDVSPDAEGLAVPEPKKRPLSVELAHSIVNQDRPAVEELERTVLNRLEDLEGGDNATRGRARRGAVDVEETRFRPWNTNKRIFNIMVQLLGGSEKDKIMCEKLMRCSHKFKLLESQDVINKQQEASLKALELAILATFDQFLPPSDAS
mmetsp:Transcript_12266/g.49230  ORF Transcript_12266/g.49230 Transcript_12266/m.49230 type:complete len:266 (+) Transcript_12266:80-877(+)